MFELVVFAGLAGSAVVASEALGMGEHKPMPGADQAARTSALAGSTGYHYIYRMCLNQVVNSLVHVRNPGYDPPELLCVDARHAGSGQG